MVIIKLSGIYVANWKPYDNTSNKQLLVCFQIQLIFHTEMPKYMLDTKTGMNKYETGVFPYNRCFSDNSTILLHYLSL